MRLTNSAVQTAIRRRLGDGPADRLKDLPAHVQLHHLDLDAALFSAVVPQNDARTEPLRLSRVDIAFAGGVVELEPEDALRHPLTLGLIEPELPAAFASPFKSGAMFSPLSPLAPAFNDFDIHLARGAAFRAELRMIFRTVDGAANVTAYYGDLGPRPSVTHIVRVVGSALMAAGDDARLITGQQLRAQPSAVIELETAAEANLREADGLAVPETKH